MATRIVGSADKWGGKGYGHRVGRSEHSDDETPTLIQSVQRALRLVEAVVDLDERAQAKQLARSLGLNLSTTYHLLRTLTHEGYLERRDDGRYLLGPALTKVAQSGIAHTQLSRLRPILHNMRQHLHTSVYLARYDEGEISIVDIAKDSRGPQIDLWVGLHDAAHATALGKCILGQLSADKRNDYLSRHPLPALTSHTITNRRTLDGTLARTHSPVTDAQEYFPGLWCIAVPVRSSQWTGSLAIARPCDSVSPSRSISTRSLERATTQLTVGAGHLGRALALTP